MPPEPGVRRVKRVARRVQMAVCGPERGVRKPHSLACKAFLLARSCKEACARLFEPGAQSYFAWPPGIFAGPPGFWPCAQMIQVCAQGNLLCARHFLACVQGFGRGLQAKKSCGWRYLLCGWRFYILALGAKDRFAAVGVSRWFCVSARSRPHFGHSDGHRLYRPTAPPRQRSNNISDALCRLSTAT